jgi:hypothetical protein
MSPTSVFKDGIDLPEGPFPSKKIRHRSAEDLSTANHYTDLLPTKKIIKRYSDLASRNRQEDIEAGNLSGL